MFTGLIEEIGKISLIRSIAGGKKISISAQHILDDLEVDHSVCIDGVCLTVVAYDHKGFTVDAVGETLSKSLAANYRLGDRVNLERALRLSDRLGGHFVQGHVNGTGHITKIEQRGENWYYELQIPPELQRYVIPEGSIAVNGISLTVAYLDGINVGISVIPHTYDNTTLQFTRVGHKVNIETDFLGRYIENFLQSSKNRMSEEWLKKLGY